LGGKTAADGGSDDVVMAPVDESVPQPTTPPTVADAAASYVFRLEGDYWTVVYDGAVCRVRDVKGMRYLALLLAQPGERLSIATLLGEAGLATAGVPIDPERARPAVTKRIRDAITRLGAHNAALGYHLATAIKTGQHCAYIPDPQRPMEWAL